MTILMQQRNRTFWDWLFTFKRKGAFKVPILVDVQPKSESLVVILLTKSGK
jgi:hypothetical protein